MREDFKSWPRLVPVLGHRYLTVYPCSSNNPVFSIWQTDIIYYGTNLGAYLTNEFLNRDWISERWTSDKIIPIWHDFAVRTEGFIVP